MHGDSVKPEYVHKIAIGRREQLNGSRPPTAIQIVRGHAIPIPDCPPPAYIAGFPFIIIRSQNYYDGNLAINDYLWPIILLKMIHIAQKKSFYIINT
jgi:hypothetical protein